MNAMDVRERIEVRIRACPCDGDCSTCELFQRCLEEIERHRDALERISCLSHSELHHDVRRGA
jgi:hypothetical protein